MSVSAFNGKVVLLGTGLQDISTVPGAMVNWLGKFSFAEYSGKYLGTDAAVGDIIMLDTTGVDQNTYTSYAIDSIVTSQYGEIEVTFTYLPTNNNPSGPPDLSASIGLDGVITRRTQYSNLMTIPSTGLQLLPDAFATQLTNDNNVTVIDPGLADVSVIPGTYTNANITVDSKGRVTSASTGAEPTGGTGTVTSVSVATANGVSGTVATDTTTPAITLSLGAITPTSVAASGTVLGSNLSGTNTGDETAASIKSKLGITTLSGSNTGDQTIALTGDVTGTGTGSFATTLANTTVTAGAYTLANITVDSKGRITSASSGTAGGTGTVTSTSIVTANGVSGTVATPTTTPAITLTLGAITPTSVAATGAVSGSNLSGTNTGDETLATIKTKLGVTTLSGSNTGDQTITLTGDVTGTGTGSFATALANTTVTIGSYGSATSAPTFTVDSKGRLTAAGSVVITPAFSSITGKPTTLAGYGITDAVAANSELTAFAAVATTGLSVRTGTNAHTTRSIAASGIGLSVANADGVAGNPTVVSNATNANTTSTIVARDASGNFSANTITANLTGNATTATSLATARSISATGDASWTVNFDGSAAATASLTLANSGVTAGTYKSVTVDSKGRVAAGTNPTTLAGYGITDAINTSALGAASGVATLDVSGKVPTSQLPGSILGAMNYQGTWNASTNTPTLVNSVGTKGYYYKVSVAGTTTIDGNANWSVGDVISFNGSTWDQIQGGSTDVSSVFGRVGAIVLQSSDVTTALGFTPYNATNPAGYTTNTGTVTSVSITSANGISGTVATSTTTPAITLTLGALTGTSFNGITGLSAVVGTALGTAAVGTSTAAARADHIHPAPTFATGGLSVGASLADTTTTSVTTTTATVIDSIASASYRSAKYVVQVVDTTNSQYHLVEILVIHDNTTVYKTEYGEVTIAAALGTFDADITGGQLRLTFTATAATTKTVKVHRTALTV